MKNNKECVIFDMDGCLIDSEKAYIRAWKYAFDFMNIDISLETLDSWAGGGAKQINEGITKYTGSEEIMWKLRGIRETHFDEELDNGNISLMPGALEIVDYAKNNAQKIAVASSTIKIKAEKLLKHFALYDLMDFCLFGDMIAHQKPAPDIYLEAIKLSGFSANECIAFEDSDFGCRAAIAAGVDVVHVPDVGTYDLNIPVFKRISSLNQGIDILEEVLAK